ncbi:uncharacterized protein LOC108164676 [Drosophila miranda]|uniref:uncharacterized protein LOC108164676 n=1 Tax=Drosophila miranda TaxID=7229 RepID=UPI0007E69379|nr:uncharacterized protein LOC108164676 [Drosophila miranda]
MSPIPTDDVPNELGHDISDIDLHDVPAQLENSLKPKFHETKSLFNINIDEIFETTTADEEVQEYKDDIKARQQKWIDFMVYATKKGEKALKTYEGTLANREDLNPIPEVKPNAEQQAYLDQGPDFQNFIRGHLEFRKNYEVFKQKHEEMRELKARIMQRCRFRLNFGDAYVFNQNLGTETTKKPSKRG